MSRLSIYFLVGIAALGFIGIAESTGSSCRFCVQDLIDALKCHKYCNVRKLCDLLQRYMRYKATLTASVIAEIVRFSCSSDCGDGFVATTDLISLCNILIGSGTLFSGEVYLSTWLNICYNIWTRNFNTCHSILSIFPLFG
ncbi:uncharacterized protein LOC122848337 [Aphidius gifuensis]|uniref:uncharacterized protein LOC122848337 n=1 Tax=Aphidius gifuensis TaxID=684658 RepID=UPI001CDD4066|nr:uncharacterized protein LOC122848337 [Aphidius gifuensis]